MNRVICVGNALRDGDRAGPLAYALLSRRGVPEGVELVDGGLAGLGLLGFMDGAESVVFIDSVRGFGEPGSVIVLEPGDVRDVAGAEPLDHASDLSYLFGVYEKVLDAPPNRVRLVGVEEPADGGAVARAVEVALATVVAGAEVSNGAPQG